MSRWQHFLAIGFVLAIATGCGVQADTAPRDLPEREAIFGLRGRSLADAVGAERVYFVGPGDERLLRSVARSAENAEQLISVLFQGTTDTEQSAQFTTAIPQGTRLLSTRSQGQALIIDISEQITELTGASLSEALAQLVYTATEIEGIETVQIRVNGTEQSWPTGTGENKTSLQTYDFPNQVQTSQPHLPTLASSG